MHDKYYDSEQLGWRSKGEVGGKEGTNQLESERDRGKEERDTDRQKDKRDTERLRFVENHQRK